MKPTRFSLLCLLLPLLTLACNQDDDCLDSSISLDQYISDNMLTVQKFSEQTGIEGLRYRILTEGSAEKPVASSTVTVNYLGYTTDRDTFDRTTGSPISFPLSNLIRGWQQGIPLIGSGGRIELFIPSALAYGPNAAGSLCADTDLIFEIDLVSFQ